MAAGTACALAGSWLLPQALPALVLLAAGWLLVCAGAGGVPRPALLALLLAGGVLLRAPVLPRDPATSGDAYRYLFEGRMVAHGENPYRIPPDSPRLARLRDARVHPRIGNPSISTIYPPAAQALFLAGHLLGGTLLGWKGLLLVLELLAAWALGLRQLGLGRSLLPVAVFFWNPLLVVESSEAGHVDAAGASLLLCALLALEAGRRSAGSLVLWLSLLVKPVAAPLIPVFLRGRRSAAGLLAGGLLAPALLLPVSATPPARLDLGPQGASVLGGDSLELLDQTPTWRDAGEGMVDVEGLGRGPAALDGRAAFLRDPEGRLRVLAASPQVLLEGFRNTRGAGEVLGRYRLGVPGSWSPSLLVAFDGSSTVELLEPAGGELGYYVDPAGSVVLFDPSRNATLGVLRLTGDRSVLAGPLLAPLGPLPVDRVLGLKVAEDPFMGLKQHSRRLSSHRALLHPLLVRITGSRSGALFLAAGLLMATGILARLGRMPAAGAVLLCGGLAVACLPVIRPWYLLWLLPGAALTRSRPLSLALGAGLATGLLLHLAP